MSTATEARTAEEAAIDRGWATFRNAMNTMWPASVRNAVKRPVADLLDALELYSELLNEDIHPATAYDDLADHRDDALAVALERAAQAVGEQADELVRVFPACALEGREAA